MIALVAASLLSAAPVGAVRAALTDTVLAAKKKKKKRAKPSAKPDEKEEEEVETSEGLDLTEPTPAPGGDTSTSSSAEPVAPNEEAAPAESSADGWSLVTPRTVGEGANVIELGAGWPGVYAGFTRGILKDLDVGARVGFNYGWEGMLTALRPGLRIQLFGKYLLTELAGLPLGLSFAPGALIYFFPLGVVRGGLTLPIAATLGLPKFVDKLNVSVTLELPFWVVFGSGVGVPFVAGANAEYAIMDSLLVFAKVKPLGLTLFAGGGLLVFYTFEATVGAAYHL
jgi:hypothetical protein